MSERDLQRVQVLGEVTNRRRTIASAAAVLALSTGQVHRLLKAHRLGGAGAIAHSARGRPSNNRLADQLRDSGSRAGGAAYADFGPTLAAEMLAQKHGLKVSRETLRGWMIETGLWLSRQQRRRLHQPRLRREALGELSRSTAASIAGPRTAPSPARCSCSSTMPRAGSCSCASCPRRAP